MSCHDTSHRWDLPAVAAGGRRGEDDPAILALLASLYRAEVRPTAPPSQGAERRLLRGGLSGWRVQRVTRFMEDRLDRTITLGELADLVGLSRCHFCTAFGQTMGCTPREWLAALRLRRACSLLAGSHLSVTQVALAVGFQTPGAFAARFRRVLGVTPTAFRARMGAERLDDEDTSIDWD